MFISTIHPDFFKIIESMSAIELEKAISTKCGDVFLQCILCGIYQPNKKYGIQIEYDRTDELLEFFPGYLTPFIQYSYGLLDHFRRFQRRFRFDTIGFYQIILEQPEPEITHTIGMKSEEDAKYYTIIYVIEKPLTISLDILIGETRYPLLSNTCYILNDWQDKYKIDRYSGVGTAKWIMIKFYEK